MQKIITEFVSGFRSEHTQLSYKTDLTQFLSFCATECRIEIHTPTEIGETLCTMWFHHLRSSSNPTLSRKMATLSSFFKFCQRKKMIQNNPVEFINRPKTSHTGKTNILTKAEWLHVFECAQKRAEYARIRGHHKQFKLWTKRYTILHTLFTAGLRVSELCKLKHADLENIGVQTYRLHLIAKGNQKHSPLIHPKTATVLLDYMEKFSITHKTQFIFENIDRTTVHSIVKRCVKEAGIIKNVSAHSLRASLATHLHQNHVPLGHIKDLLNHKNIATTLLYTRVSEEELQANAELLE